MADERRQRLEAVIARRDKTREAVQRVKGRLDHARTELAAVEEECRKRGVPPEQLDTVIEKLGAKYDVAVAELERHVAVAEKEIAPYLEGSDQ